MIVVEEAVKNDDGGVGSCKVGGMRARVLVWVEMYAEECVRGVNIDVYPPARLTWTRCTL